MAKLGVEKTLAGLAAAEAKRQAAGTLFAMRLNILSGAVLFERGGEIGLVGNYLQFVVVEQEFILFVFSDWWFWSFPLQGFVRPRR